MGSISSKSKKAKGDESVTTVTDEPVSPLKKRKVDCKDFISKADKTKTTLPAQLSASVEPSFVFKRKGSMYFDDEGSVAHEFYEEVRPEKPGAKPHMKRLLTNLTPQGEVLYNYPRLSGDCDIIICDP